MPLRCGIIGLPNVGKSTLFNALTESQNAEASNYPFCTIEPNVGTIIVPDERLKKIASIYNPKTITPNTVEFVDIAGLVKGASKGEGLGNQFLSHIREVDAIIHIVRCFDDEKIIHVYNKVDPKTDVDTVETELILKDLETVNRRIEKISKLIRVGDKKKILEYDLLVKIKDHLENARLAKYFTDKLNTEEYSIIKDLHLLTDNPVLYVANVDMNNINGNNYSKILEQIAFEEGARFLTLSVQIEAEIASLETIDERKQFLTELGIEESGLNKLVKASYELLDLITFFTAGEKEVHAWTVKKGTKASEAAGKIHTDFEKGFIRAEIFHYEDLISLGNESSVKMSGKMRIEGKDYVVEDGDIIYFRFNV